MADTFKSGDVVIFKSHPKNPMTVESTYGSQVVLVWFHPTTNDFQKKVVNSESVIRFEGTIE